jgi:hypothetical protein
MTHILRSSLVCILALGCFACAATPNNDQAAEPQERVYRTGSHVPVRDTESGFARSQDVQSVQDEMRRSSGTGPYVPGK